MRWMTREEIGDLIAEHLTLLALSTIGLILVAMLLGALLRRRRTPRGPRKKRPLLFGKTLILAAIGIATYDSAAGTLRFFREELHQTGLSLALGFAFFEIVTFAFGYVAYMRRAAGGSAGGVAWLSWGMAGLAGFFSATAATGVADYFYRYIPPLTALVLVNIFERLEDLLRKVDDALESGDDIRTKLKALNWAIGPEQLLAKWGWINAKTADVSEMAKRRLMTRAAKARYRFELLTKGQAAKWRINRAGRRVDRSTLAMNEQLGMATDPALRAEFDDYLDTLYTARSATSPAAVAERIAARREADRPKPTDRRPTDRPDQDPDQPDQRDQYDQTKPTDRRPADRPKPTDRRPTVRRTIPPHAPKSPSPAGDVLRAWAEQYAPHLVAVNAAHPDWATEHLPKASIQAVLSAHGFGTSAYLAMRVKNVLDAEAGRTTTI